MKDFELIANAGEGIASVSHLRGLEPEFVRITDLRALCGLKRGFVYLKINDGTFRSISLRRPGSKFGVRLVYWPSVKAWLHTLLGQQNGQQST